MENSFALYNGRWFCNSLLGKDGLKIMEEKDMKVVIWAGGLGTRISEESHLRPKPMIEIGGMPILWHIMKIYSHYGFNDFIICLGYKQYVVKEFFANYFLYNSDVTFDLKNNSMQVLSDHVDPWKVTLIDTGLHTMTGGRLKRVKDYIGNHPFLLTYGDGVSDVNINDVVKFHQFHGKLATLTTVNIAQMKGVLEVNSNNDVESFREKFDEDASLINGGFMVLQPEVFDYIEGDNTMFEQEPLRQLAAEGQLKSYYHKGFWQCMDTQREKQKLEALWASGNAPWKVW